MTLDKLNISLLCATVSDGGSGCSETVYWTTLDLDTWELRYFCTHWSDEHDMPLPSVFDSEAEMNEDIGFSLKYGASFWMIDREYADFYHRMINESLQYL